jgi:Periplasmic protease
MQGELEQVASNLFGRTVLSLALGLSSIATAQPEPASVARLTKVFDLIQNDYAQPVDMAPLASAAANSIRQSAAVSDATWDSCLRQNSLTAEPPKGVSAELKIVEGALGCASATQTPAQLDAIVDVAIKAMLTKLDDSSKLVTPADFGGVIPKGPKDFPASVGLTLRKDARGLIVFHAVRNGPAGQAGIAVGDVVVAIDDVSTKDFSLDEAIQKLRGTENSPITLAVAQADGTTRKLNLRRKTLNPIDAAFYAERRGAVLIIELTSLPIGIADAVKARISAEGRGVQTIILDLRDNAGALHRSREGAARRPRRFAKSERVPRGQTVLSGQVSQIK